MPGQASVDDLARKVAKKLRDIKELIATHRIAQHSNDCVYENLDWGLNWLGPMMGYMKSGVRSERYLKSLGEKLDRRHTNLYGNFKALDRFKNELKKQFDRELSPNGYIAVTEQENYNEIVRGIIRELPELRGIAEELKEADQARAEAEDRAKHEEWERGEA